MAAAGRRRVDVSLSSPSPPPLPSFSPSLAARSTVGTLGESIFDSDSVPSSLVEEIAPVLRAANEVDDANPCVAYLCRFYAFEKAHRLDPISSGPGVRQFKTTLLQTLERGNDPRLKGKILRTDAREMRSFYNHYNKKYIKPLQNSADKAHHAVLTEACQTAAVLIEVSKAINLWPRSYCSTEPWPAICFQQYCTGCEHRWTWILFCIWLWRNWENISMELHSHSSRIAWQNNPHCCFFGSVEIDQVVLSFISVAMAVSVFFLHNAT